MKAPSSDAVRRTATFRTNGTANVMTTKIQRNPHCCQPNMATHLSLTGKASAVSQTAAVRQVSLPEAPLFNNLTHSTAGGCEACDFAADPARTSTPAGHCSRPFWEFFTHERRA